MRSREQIERTVGEYRDHKAHERERALSQFLSMCATARANHEPWIRWIDDGCPELTRAEYARVRPAGAKRSKVGGRNGAS